MNPATMTLNHILIYYNNTVLAYVVNTELILLSFILGVV